MNPDRYSSTGGNSESEGWVVPDPVTFSVPRLRVNGSSRRRWEDAATVVALVFAIVLGLNLAYTYVDYEPRFAKAKPQLESVVSPYRVPDDMPVIRHNAKPKPSPVETAAPADEEPKDDGSWAWPTDIRTISSPFGMRSDPFTGAQSFHSGTDFALPCGENTYSTRPGIVSFAGPAGGYGYRVVVDHADGFSSSYNHLEKTLVNVGEPVDKGDLVGLIGTTGRSTGCHLHFEIMIDHRFTDPMPYLEGKPNPNPKTYGWGDIPYSPIQDTSIDPCEREEGDNRPAECDAAVPAPEPQPAESETPEPTVVEP